MQKYIYILLLTLLSCQNGKEKTLSTLNIDKAEQKDTVKKEEDFTDSLKIGCKKLNLLNIKKYRAADSNYVDITFYKKENLGWKEQQKIHFIKDGITSCDPIISDFNNDGYNDLSVQSDIAGRGANIIRRLYIYDKLSDKLIYIKNSEKYPNLQYNDELDCLDAFRVTGWTYSEFLKISADSLILFASVGTMDGITVSEYDKKGKATVIFVDKKNRITYVRYKTYKPLKEYESY